MEQQKGRFLKTSNQEPREAETVHCLLQQWHARTFCMHTVRASMARNGHILITYNLLFIDCAPLRSLSKPYSPSCNQDSSATPIAHVKSEGSQGSTPLITAVIGGWGITWDDVLSWVWLSFSHWRSRLASLAVTGQTQVRFLVVTVLSVLTIEFASRHDQDAFPWSTM